MTPAIRSRITKNGNAQCVRIPKPLLEQAGLHENTAIEIEVRGNELVIRARAPRAADGSSSPNSSRVSS